MFDEVLKKRHTETDSSSAAEQSAESKADELVDDEPISTNSNHVKADPILGP